MPKPDTNPNPDANAGANPDAISDRTLAEAYLREALGDRPVSNLTHAGTFDEQPLETEGRVSLFRFSAALDGSETSEYWVAAGQTKPNYYPDWGLTADQMYSLHVGTRFMLELQIPTVPIEDWPADWRPAIEAFIRAAVPGEPFDEPIPAAGFRLEDGIYVVCRARIADQPAYVLGLACPPAIYREVNAPPRAVFRLHLGNLIRAEAERERKSQRRIRARDHRPNEL